MADKPEAFVVRSTLPPFSHYEGRRLAYPAHIIAFSSQQDCT
jgi:hypothetical protein